MYQTNLMFLMYPQYLQYHYFLMNLKNLMYPKYLKYPQFHYFH